ncbi:hypothetical protein DFH09DRAFT_1194273 [Mycena vulgaris]|nr:hypothetical protein DFH09DRAFT_1194273 [Mycena vulgaris]
MRFPSPQHARIYPSLQSSAAVRPRFSGVGVSVNLDTGTTILDSTRSFDPHECSKHVWRDARMRDAASMPSPANALRYSSTSFSCAAASRESSGTPSFGSHATSFEAREEEAESARIQDVEGARCGGLSRAKGVRVRLKIISWRVPVQAMSLGRHENATTPGGLCLAQFGR